MCHALVTDPEYLQAERARNRDRSQPFDTLGLCLLAVTMVCWEVMLSKGQQWDWFGDPFFRVQTLFILFVLGLSILIYHELPLRNPLIALKTLADRNFATCCIVTATCWVACPVSLAAWFNCVEVRVTNWDASATSRIMVDSDPRAVS